MQKISGEKLGILNEEGIQMFESMRGSLVKSFGDFAVVDEVAVDLFRTVFTKEQFNIVVPGASYKKNTS